jgi:adenylylsulfate kinase-like enzyme
MRDESLRFNILKDEPLTNKDADRFGYSDIADKITYIIQNVKPSFTIGLYGKWGSGKTSICKLVENNLEKDKNFKVFYFDVWKYEKDSFRRQFLIQLEENLKLGLDLKEILNQDLSLTDPTVGELKIDKRILFNPLGIILIIICLISLTILILTFYIPLLNKECIRLISSIVFSSTFSGFILQGLVTAITRVQKNITKHKTDSAEGFERLYNQILKELKERKLLIIIDNLDRLLSENAISVLSDIKTFLAKDGDNNNSIFLIPCDHESINGHLHKIYGDDFDADEYLRKFFNLTFKIPKLLDLELDDYTSEKLKETKIPEFNQKENYYPLIFVITNAFRDNPREIIQFINSLIASFILAKKRNLTEVLCNLGFLAKILVIRQKWPLEYVEIENQILRIGKGLDEAFNLLKENIGKEKGDREREREQRIKRIEEFLRTTSSINAYNQDVFFSLHKSKQEETLPEWTSFVLSAEERRERDLKDLYIKIKNNNKINELNSLLIDRYYRKNRENKTKLLNVFISIVKILESEEQLEDFKEFLSYSFEILDEPNIYIDSINDINFVNLLNGNAIRIIPKEFYDKFLSTMISVLTSTKGATNQPAIELKKGIELFRLISADLIWARLGKHHNSLEDAKNKFIQNVSANEIINTTDKNEKINKFISFILDTKPITSRIVPASLNKINDIVSHPSIGEYEWKILETTKQLLSRIQHPDIADNSYITSISNFSNTIINRYNHTPDWEKRSILIKIIFSLKEVKGNNFLGQLNNIIVNFIMSCPYEQVSTTILKEKLIKMIEEVVFKSAIIDRSKSLPDIFIRYDLKNYFEEKEIDTIIKSLISHHQQFLEFLKYLDFKVPENSRKWLLDSMINAINQIPSEIFEDWLIGIKKLRITDYPDSIENFRIRLKNAKQRGEEFNNKVKDFVSNNKKLFEGIVEELTK